MMKKPYWFMPKPGRRGIAEMLRYLADRIGPEDAFAATGIHFYFQNGIGMVIEKDEGIRTNRTGPGVRCWYRRSDYDKRRFGDIETARNLLAFEELIRECNEK